MTQKLEFYQNNFIFTILLTNIGDKYELSIKAIDQTKFTVWAAELTHDMIDQNKSNFQLNLPLSTIFSLFEQNIKKVNNLIKFNYIMPEDINNNLKIQIIISSPLYNSTPNIREINLKYIEMGDLFRLSNLVTNNINKTDDLDKDIIQIKNNVERLEYVTEDICVRLGNNELINQINILNKKNLDLEEKINKIPDLIFNFIEKFDTKYDILSGKMSDMVAVYDENLKEISNELTRLDNNIIKLKDVNKNIHLLKDDYININQKVDDLQLYNKNFWENNKKYMIDQVGKNIFDTYFLNK
jgi:hypothetical protein